jgi:hypothetical protein
MAVQGRPIEGGAGCEAKITTKQNKEARPGRASWDEIKL